MYTLNTLRKTSSLRLSMKRQKQQLHAPIFSWHTIFLLLLVSIPSVLGFALYFAGHSFSSADLFSPPPHVLSQEQKIRSMVRGHPIEEMASAIAHQGQTTSAFLVAIAKKESNWGKVSPTTSDGQTCYNYWGYRGKTGNELPSGYTCFESPEEAVSVVGRRVRQLERRSSVRTPGDMVHPWKCGWACETHDPASVAKWVQDVGYYFSQLR